MRLSERLRQQEERLQLASGSMTAGLFAPMQVPNPSPLFPGVQPAPEVSYGLGGQAILPVVTAYASTNVVDNGWVFYCRPLRISCQVVGRIWALLTLGAC